MFRTDQPREAFFRSVLMRRADRDDRNYSGIFFVGSGDQFDDDRRLVREAASARPAIRLTVGWRFLSGHFRR